MANRLPGKSTQGFRSLRTGVSMVEILVGVIILALVLIPSLWVLISNTQTITSTRDHVMAGFYAQRILETLRTYSFEYLEMDQFSANPVEAKKTAEYDMTHDESGENDKIKLQEKVNNITYILKDPKIELVKNKNDTSMKPRVALVSFRIEYKGLDNKTHHLNVQTALNN